jgi:hypothetical protein
MTLYLGLPITTYEAFRLLNLNYENIFNKIIVKHKLTINSYLDCYFIDYLNNYFKECSVNIRIFYIDKGQCIFGYELKEPSNVWNKFINIDEFIILVEKLRRDFSIETRNLDIDLKEVTLEYMEGEPETVNYPSPFVISY